MKTNIPLPFGHRKNKFHLPYQMVSTSDFGKISPICLTEMVPGDDFNVVSKSFVRLAPLPVPTFADITLETSAFYVPLRQLWYDGREFFANQKYFSPTNNSVITSRVPTVCNSMFIYAMINLGYAKVTTAQSSDFLFTFDPSAGVQKFNFTSTGRTLYSLLCSLGYQFSFDSTDDTEMSLLPFLAYIHIYHEYYLPQIAYPNPAIKTLLGRDSYYFFTRCDSWKSLTPALRKTDQTNNVAYQILDELDYICFGYLKPDYFTSAWKYPSGNPSNYNGAVSDNNFQIKVPQTTNDTKVFGNAATDYPPALSSSQALTNVGLNLLKAVTNYVTRNSVAGNKLVDRFFARFGIKLPDLVLQRPVFLGKSVQQVSISDVTSTSSVPNGSGLGDYAGKGSSFGDGKFSYSADEYGYFIILQTIQPHTGIATGRKRHTVHLSFDEFYTPEFDCIGVQAIRKDEVFCRFNSESVAKQYKGTGYKPDGVFGYCPRYSEYKFGSYTLSGDFVTGSRFANMKSYHLYRDSFVGDPVLDKPFLAATNSDYNDFNRIFTYSGNEYDHFFTIHETDITAYRNMHQIGDTLDLEDVHGEGRSVVVDYGGKHL